LLLPRSRRMRLALSGKFYSGKSIAAEILAREFGFVRLSLADELKAMAAEIVQFLQEHGGLEQAGVLLDKTTPLGRQWLQWLGTDLIRKRDADFWVRLLLRKLRTMQRDNVVVDDVRFRNEAYALRQVGFKLIRIETSEATRRRRAQALGAVLVPEREGHPSETDLDEFLFWDAILSGDEPIHDFRETVRVLVKELSAGGKATAQT